MSVSETSLEVNKMPLVFSLHTFNVSPKLNGFYKALNNKHRRVHVSGFCIEKNSKTDRNYTTPII